MMDIEPVNHEKNNVQLHFPAKHMRFATTAWLPNFNV
jgi:hypothetical protein